MTHPTPERHHYNVTLAVLALDGIALTLPDERWQVIVAMVVLGAGPPLTFTATAKIVVDAIRPDETGVANEINTVMRTVGGVVVGEQVGAASSAHISSMRRRRRPKLRFVTAFCVGAGAALLATSAALFVTPRRRGDVLVPREAEK